MLIITKHKDYYDYVGKLYGEDKLCVWNRNNTNPTLYTELDNINKFDCSNQPYTRHSHLYPDYKKIICSVAGDVHMLLFHKNNYVGYLNHNDSFAVQHSWDKFSRGDSMVFPDNQRAIEIHKTIKQPIFFAETSYTKWITVLKYNPPIEHIKVVKDFYSPEQIWQKLYHFCSNVLRENPDTMQPVQVDDKTKIVQAGFDLKTSFRGKQK